MGARNETNACIVAVGLSNVSNPISWLDISSSIEALLRQDLAEQEFVLDFRSKEIFVPRIVDISALPSKISKSHTSNKTCTTNIISPTTPDAYKMTDSLSYRIHISRPGNLQSIEWLPVNIKNEGLLPDE